MPHPVGGAMGVALCTAVKRGHTRFDIISLNIHKTTSHWHLPGDGISSHRLKRLRHN